jgi:hypothetical protein
VTDSCELGNETLGSTKDGSLVDKKSCCASQDGVCSMVLVKEG